MIKSLELTNFGGYRSLQLEFAPITVLIGSNASGKTTLLRALSILMAGVDVAARLASEDDSGRMVVPGKPLAALASSSGGWKRLFTQARGSSADHLAVQGIYDGAGWISKGRLTATAFSGAQPSVTMEVEARVPGAPRPLSVRGTSAALIDHVSTLRLDETYLSDDDLRLAADPGAQAATVRNRLIRLDEAAIERLNRTLRKLSKVEIVSRTSLADALAGAPLAVHYRSDGSPFEIHEANHAVVSVLTLFSGIEAQLAGSTAASERLLLLDEPELHLHPVAQAAMAEHLVDIARAAGAQIVSVTHSDHIVRRLFSHPDSAIISIERPFARLKRLHSQKDLLKALGETHDLTPFSAINFLKSRRVLFIEGKTDEAILQRCAIAHFGASSDRLARFELWTPVPLDGVSRAPAADLTERIFSSPFLPRLDRGEAFMIACVLDRDYDKEPRHESSSRPQVDRVDHVWSRHSIESLFVEIDVLESLLLVALGAAAPGNVRERVSAAIAAADSDENLREEAEDELAEVLRRTRQYSGKAAQVEARQRVRANPEIWQRGKSRAEFVLRYIRDSMDASLQNKVKSSVCMILESIRPEDLGRVKVPLEVVALLDELVARATN